MKKRFTLKRIIIILSIALVYSLALCFIGALAKDSILYDISFSDKSASALSASVIKNPSDGSSPEASAPVNHETPLSLENIANKADIDDYGIFAAVTTVITSEKAATSAEEETSASVATSAPKSEEPTTATVTETHETTTAPEADDEAETTEKSVLETEEKTTTTEEDVIINDDDNSDEEVDIDDESNEDVEIIEDDEENPDPDVTIADDIFDEEYIQSILEEYYENQNQNGFPPESFIGDNLYNGKSYRDDIITIYDKTSGRYVTDNAFDLVCRITFNEVGTSMHPEAIKAQAVAAYTYIKYYQQKGEYASISTKSDVPQLVIDCVNAVDGLAMYYDGEYIFSPFSASTGGVTCSSKNVWGGDRPYLQSVRNDFDHLDAKNYGRVTTYTADEVRRKIESKTDIKLSDDCENWIKILSYTDGNYVGQLSIDGHTTAEVSGKERDLTAYVFRAYILNIRSTCFTVSYANGVFTFVTYGYGHGVGLSQTGADLYAEYGGYSFDRILHHYYTDINIY